MQDEATEPIYPFEVLYYRPQIRRLESFTSYLSRCAAENEYTSADGFWSTCMVTQDRRVLRNINDLPSLALAAVSRVTTRQLDELLSTTLHHVGAKFARSRNPQSLSRFLGKSIFTEARFCPQCLAKNGYRQLVWQFRALLACPEHKILLLDRCPYCGLTISSFKPPFDLLRCPKCHGDLTAVSTSFVSEDVVEVARQCEHDLEFLVSRQDWEVDASKIIGDLGQHLAKLRIEKGYTAVEMAEIIGITPNAIQGIEQADVLRKGASFEDYQVYLQDLNVTFEDAFNVAVARYFDPDLFPGTPRQEVLLEQVRRIVDEATHTGSKATIKGSARLLNVSPGVIRRNRRAVALIKGQT